MKLQPASRPKAHRARLDIRNKRMSRFFKSVDAITSLSITSFLRVLMMSLALSTAILYADASYSSGVVYFQDGLKYFIKYNSPDGEESLAEIIGYDFNSQENVDIIIPEYIEYEGVKYPVRTIGYTAFEHCDALTSVYIPNSITTIETGAFSCCEKLKYVEIPDSITVISDYVFSGTGLTSIAIPESVTSIGSCAFFYCENLTSIKLPDSLTYLGDYAFYYCENLNSIKIPDLVTTIEQETFCGTGLTSIELPESLICIGEAAFASCENLTSIEIPNSVTTIKQQAFENSGLTSIKIPDSVITIEPSAFSYCLFLTDIELSNSLTCIDYSLFSGCERLETISIPSSVSIIQDWAFSSCSNLKEVIIEDGTDAIMLDSRMFSDMDDSNISLYIGRNWEGGDFRNIKQVIFGSSVTYINDESFWGNENLLSVKFSDSLYNISIGEVAFGYCKALKSIELPQGLTTIGEYAFSGCSGIEYLELPNTLTTIGDGAFAVCKQIKSVNIPNSVTSIGYGAFSYCLNLESLHIPSELNILGEHIFYECSKLNEIYYFSNSPIEVSKRVFEINFESYFFDLEKFTLYIAKGTRDIFMNTMPWMYFKNIVESVLPPTMESYDGRYMTIDCEDADAAIYYFLDDSNMADPIEYTGPFDVRGVREVNAVSMLEGYSDGDMGGYSIPCYADESHAIVYRPGTLSDAFGWMDEEGLESIKTFAIGGDLNSDDFAFIRTMEGLKHLDLKAASIQTIPDYAFEGMNLQTVEFPKGLQSYGSSIFKDCHDLYAITINSTVKPSTNTFSETGNPNVLCYVCEEYMEANGDIGDICGLAGVIVLGDEPMAESITLTDGHPFHCPIAFTTEEARFVKSFSMETEIGGMQGWGTIAVPFDVDEFRRGDDVLVPFSAYKECDATRPFWLYAPNGNGWEKSERMMAYSPYLISMPNNPFYDDDYNITGNVTFIGHKATIEMTPEVEGTLWKQGNSMWPTFNPISKKEGLYVVNDAELDRKAPGSMFVKGEHDVRPFECYVTSTSAKKVLPLFDSSDVELLSGMSARIWSENGDILIESSCPMALPIYDLSGRIVRNVQVKSGERHIESGLTRGVYFVGNVKLLVH